MTSEICLQIYSLFKYAQVEIFEMWFVYSSKFWHYQLPTQSFTATSSVSLFFYELNLAPFHKIQLVEHFLLLWGHFKGTILVLPHTSDQCFSLYLVFSTQLNQRGRFVEWTRLSSNFAPLLGSCESTGSCGIRLIMLLFTTFSRIIQTGWFLVRLGLGSG